MNFSFHYMNSSLGWIAIDERAMMDSVSVGTVESAKNWLRMHGLKYMIFTRHEGEAYRIENEEVK